MTTPILAAEADGAYGVILPAPGELLYGIIAFTIVFVVLAKFAFPALGRVLDERASAIQGRMEEAEAKLTEAEEAKRRYESAISDAKGEAGRIIEEAREQADALRAEARERAETEAAQIIERAQADVAAERDRALQDLRNQVGSISVELASRIVERELDQSTHAALVDEYIERLSSQN
ncbi:MAG: F0F1 ATP synthase subunit B [Nitriliruptoraceae bacterium]